MLQDPPSFFQSLFDFSFSSFIAERIIPVLYVLSVIVLGLISLFIIVGGFAKGIESGLLTLIIVAPLYFLISVVYVRVILELLLVIFRIADHVEEIAAQGRTRPPELRQ